MTSKHLRRHPVSASTYKNLGCRCDGCRAAASAYQRRARAARNGATAKVDARVRNRLAAWARSERPDLAERFRAEAYAELGIKRQKPGPQPGAQG